MKKQQHNGTNIPEQDPPPPEKKKSRCLKIFLLLFVLFLLLLSGTVLSLAAAAFSHPEQISPLQLKSGDLYLQQKLIGRLYREIFRKKPRPAAVVVIKSNELESLFRLADFGLTAAKLAGKYDGIDLRQMKPEIKGTRMKMEYPLDTGFSWLFGGVLRFHFSGTPAFADKSLTVKLAQCRIGRLPVPLALAEKILKCFLDPLRESREFAAFCSVIKEVRLRQDGNLVIVYYPAKVMPVLMHRTNELKRGKL